MHRAWVWVALLGCAANGDGGFRDVGAVDSARVDAGARDAGARDAGPGDAGPEDTGPEDTGPEDASEDTGTEDASEDIGPGDATADAAEDAASADTGVADAGTDAMIDASARCPGISVGDTVVLDGDGDLTAYASSQRLTPGGTLAPTDAFGIAWDQDYLYLTLVSPAFGDGFKPLHVYVEARTSLPAAAMTTGKEYSGETPVLGFMATHLIGMRRTSTGGDGVPYNGLYVPSDGWLNRTVALDEGVDLWVSSENTAMSARVAWTDLGCPTVLRLTTHVVNAEPANEWKDFLPLTATPWMAPGGGYFEIDLTADPDVAGWTEVAP